MNGSVRRGSALVLVLIMMLSLAALAASAIYMTGSSGLLSRYHDKERDLAFAVETALELGRSRLRRDTTLALYDTGYKQLLTSQAVYNSSGTALTGLTVNLYAGYTGDTTGVYVPYITLLATVSDAGGIRQARRMDLYAQSYARYSFFADNFPAAASIGAGENIPGRAHANNRFIAASSGSPNPVFSDTVSAAGTISGAGQWSDTVSSTGGTTAIPYPTTTTALWPSATGMATRFSALATAGNTSFTPVSGSSWDAYYWSASLGWVDISGRDCNPLCTVAAGSRIEFVAFDVDNSGAVDSTEGFFRVFDLQNGADTIRLATNFPSPHGTGQMVYRYVDIWNTQCGAFYTINGVRQFFPVAMHSVAWVQALIQTPGTYPAVTAAQATAMGDSSSTAYRNIMQQPTSRCFPFGSPYLMNVERFTNAGACLPRYGSFGGTSYTWGSAPSCTASDQHGGQDTTFTARAFTCQVTFNLHTGECGSTPVELGGWRAYGGTNNLPADLSPVRQTAERSYLWPMNMTYNPNYRGVIYAGGRLFVSGTIRGRATLYVNGPVSLIDDVMYDQPPADTANLCRNNFGLISSDSIMVADNAINRPRIYRTNTVPGDTSMQGGNRDFIFHGTMMTLGGSVSAFNPSGSTRTTPTFTCPTGSSFTAAGGCMQTVGGLIMKTYAAPYNSVTAGSGLRPLRELDPCQMQNRRPPYFPLARTRVRTLRSFEVDARQVNSAALLTAYFNRLRGARAAP